MVGQCVLRMRCPAKVPNAKEEHEPVSLSAHDPEQLARTLLSLPPEFAYDLRAALEAERRYLLTGDRAALDSATAASHRLWAHIMEPLAAALHQRLPIEPSAAPAVTLIPAGLLALLPLHAAWTEDASTPTQRRYFLDKFTVSYAPSPPAPRA
jgi:hypothetical protein